MTDLLSVIDDGLGNFMKNRVALKYSQHFEQNEENTRRWTTKGVYVDGYSCVLFQVESRFVGRVKGRTGNDIKYFQELWFC